ncbi:hypothetical protein DENSPDRAFT_544998 [Dentipellis sp. KUC8613]|nr:hypothetical protein DENSPDRAFT_544998 [Dentipellis sp. KUC8613]
MTRFGGFGECSGASRTQSLAAPCLKVCVSSLGVQVLTVSCGQVVVPSGGAACPPFCSSKSLQVFSSRFKVSQVASSFLKSLQVFSSLSKFAFLGSSRTGLLR